MSTTEDQARAAMRAIAATVHDAPPLRLAPAQDPAPAPGKAGTGGARPGRRHRVRFLLAPVAAALTVVVVAVALMTVKTVQHRSAGAAAAPSPAAASATSGNPPAGGEPPEYYVALAQAEHLIVGNTFTGQAVATVDAPANVTLEAVYGGAADDRTFIVGGSQGGADAVPAWYQLRITPGTGNPARLTTLPIPVRQIPAGVAFSPDGTEVAVAFPGSPATLRVYSVPTGTLLRDWSTTAAGEITAKKAQPDSWQFTGTTLRWSPDGQQLAFAWNASEIRVLDATAPDGNLMTSSRLEATIGTLDAPEVSFTCPATQGWQLITVAQGSAAGQGIVCGGSDMSYMLATCPSPTGTRCESTPRSEIGFLRLTENSQGDSYGGLDVGVDCPTTDLTAGGAYLGWANIDGSEVIGSQVCAGHSRFGIFRGSTFTHLPALPAPLTLPAGVTASTVAW